MKSGRFEIAVLGLFLVIGGYQLFARPLLGMADNGDFVRMTYPSGLTPYAIESGDHRFNYFYSTYALGPKPEVGIYYYHSSTHLFVGFARWLNDHLVSRQVFDVRALGAVYLAFFLLGIYLILRASRPLAFKWRCLLAAFLLIFFTDPAYLAYFNSFYSEATALVCLLIIVGCSLMMIVRRWIWAAFVGYFAMTAVLIVAKPMYVPFVVLLVPFGIYLSRSLPINLHSLKLPVKLRRLKPPVWLGNVVRYGLSTGLSCALIWLVMWYQSYTPDWLRVNAAYIAVFSILLPESPNPEADLLALNLRPEWIRYVGTDPYQADSPAKMDADFQQDFMQRIGTTTIPKFFLTHPAALYRTAAEISPQLVMTLPSYAGYYEESTGKPPQSKPPVIWTNIRAWIFPASLWMVLLYFASGAVAFGLALRRRITEVKRGLLLLYTLLVAFAAIIFLVPTVTMASIDTRYSATFTSAFDLTLLIGGGILLQFLITQWQKWRAAVPLKAAAPATEASVQ